MNTDIVVTADNLSQAWAQTLLQVADSDGHRACHVVTRVRDSTVEDPKIRELADGMLSALNFPAVDTVANTLFPRRLAEQTSDPDELAQRYLEVLPTIQRLDPGHNSKGTYFQRIISYRTPDGPQNQLAELVRRLNVEQRAAATSATGAKTARYEVGIDGAGTVEPFTGATPVHDAASDSNPMGFPCLSLLSFQLDHGQLHVVAHYRSHFLVRRAYGNYLGIADLLQYVAAQTGLEPGRMTVIAGYAQVDEYAKGRVEGLRQHANDATLFD